MYVRWYGMLYGMYGGVFVWCVWCVVSRPQIKVLGKNFKNELRQVIPNEHLPPEYGGSCSKCPGGCVAVADISMHKHGYSSLPRSPVSSPTLRSRTPMWVRLFVVCVYVRGVCVRACVCVCLFVVCACVFVAVVCRASLQEELKDHPEKVIGSRDSLEVKLECGEEGGEFTWAFAVSHDKDVEFSAQLRSGMLEWISPASLRDLGADCDAGADCKKPRKEKERKPRPHYVVEPERLSSNKGSYVAHGKASVVLRFDNSASYFTSKTIRYFACVSGPHDQEDLEHKMAAGADNEAAARPASSSTDDVHALTRAATGTSLHTSIATAIVGAQPTEAAGGH